MTSWFLATGVLLGLLFFAMSISTLLPVRGIVASGPPGVVCGPSRLGWKPLALDRIPSFRLDGRGGRIVACAAPCESLEVSAPVVENVGFGGAAFESSVLQCVKEGLVFQEGRTPELIRAAAYLRALSFYTYPEGRTEEALRVIATYLSALLSISELCFRVPFGLL